MPNLELDIELTDDRDVYHPGDTVAGTVKVVPEEEVDCSELRLTRRWQTDGDGSRDSGAESTRTLFYGGETWYGAGHYAYQFETTIPQAGPYPYSGEHIDVDWVLEAVADVPWATDPSATVEIPVQPAGDEATYRPGAAGLESARGALLQPNETSPGCGIAFGLVMAAPAILLVALVGTPPDCSNADATEGYVKTLLCGAFGIWLVGASVRQAIAKSTFDDVDFELFADTATPGDAVECRLVLPGRLQSYCRDIDLELIRTEEAENTSGKHDTTHTHVHTVESRTPEAFDPDAPPKRQTYEETFRVPEDADYSFYADHNQVKWGVRAAIDAPFWPDWSKTKPLFVQPDLDS